MRAYARDPPAFTTKCHEKARCHADKISQSPTAARLRVSSWSTLNRKASCPFVPLRGQPSTARLRVPSWSFVVNPHRRKAFASLSVPSRTKSQPQGFVSLRGPWW